MSFVRVSFPNTPCLVRKKGFFGNKTKTTVKPYQNKNGFCFRNRTGFFIVLPILDLQGFRNLAGLIRPLFQSNPLTIPPSHQSPNYLKKVN